MTASSVMVGLSALIGSSKEDIIVESTGWKGDSSLIEHFLGNIYEYVNKDGAGAPKLAS